MLELSYIGLSVLMVLIIILGYWNILKKSEMNTKNRNQKMSILIAFFLFWFSYLAFLSSQKILFDLNFPPKIPILILLPLIFITMIFYFCNRNNIALQSIQKSYLAYYQTFRIAVEILLLYTFYEGIIPKQATFEGLNFDILIGISAPFMGYFIFFENIKYQLFAKLWNILGIFMVLFVAFIIATGFYQPQIWGSQTPIVSTKFITLPYLLIAGFLAPSAIFIHVVSLMTLKK